MLELFRQFFAPPRHMILLVLGLWAGLALAERRAGRHGLAREHLSNLVFYALLGYVLGGRLAFVLGHFTAFAGSPLDVFSLSPSVFEPTGGLAAALIAGAAYAYRLKLRLWPLLDALTPVLATLAIGLSLSQLAADTGYGSQADVPWAVAANGTSRHPAQIYESLAAVAILGLMWFGRPGARPGVLFMTFAAATAGARLVLEAFRGDSTFVAGGFRIAQVTAWVMLLLALLGLEYLAASRPGPTEIEDGA
jgi:phosphatidylglycerol:prolipoprotein diacylglycerol transferase